MIIFLGLNGCEFTASKEEVVTTMLLLADNQLSERKLASWLEKHLTLRDLKNESELRDSYSSSTRCTNEIAIDPSPTADATRFTLPDRTSPTANIRGLLVSIR